MFCTLCQVSKKSMERNRACWKNDKEGNKIFEELRKEYLEIYMPKSDADPHGAVEDIKRLENSNYNADASEEVRPGYKGDLNYH